MRFKLCQEDRSCKANAAFVKGSLSALQTFTLEQESARGNFPGPVPAVFCTRTSEDLDDMEAIASSGAEGVMIKVCDGNEITDVAELAEEDASWAKACESAIQAGLQPIPEVTVAQETASGWTEDNVSDLIDKISDVIGVAPVSLVLTVNAASDDQEEPVALPPIAKQLAKRVPILGSVRASAGENRIGMEAARYKDSGFAGALLRSDCVPGFRLQLDLGIVGQFWEACINDLKSTKSKSFSFRSKNQMYKSAATNWMNYQKGVLDSGALGDPSDSVSVMDSDGGDYQGFA